MLPITEILREFEEQHGLSRDETLEGIRRAFEEVLEQRYRLEVDVYLDEQVFEVCLYGRKNGVRDQFHLPPEKIRGWNTIRRRVDLSLRKAAVFKEFDKVRPYENTLVYGTVVAIDDHGTVYVEAEVHLGQVYYCVCEGRQQPAHERRKGYQIGRRMAFRIHQVRAVLFEGVPRLKIMLDRASKTLPALLAKDLLQQQGYVLNDYQVVGAARVAGGRSLIASSHRLPRSVILAVKDELGEFVRVVFGPHAAKYLRVRRKRGGRKTRADSVVKQREFERREVRREAEREAARLAEMERRFAMFQATQTRGAA